MVDHVMRAHSITVRLGLSTAALHCRFLWVGSTRIEHMFENEFEGKPGPELFGELASMKRLDAASDRAVVGVDWD